MTCIVGYVSKGTVYMGADSASFDGYGGIIAKTHQKTIKREGILFGCSGQIRITDLLRYRLTIPPWDKNKISAEEYIISCVVTEIRKLFKTEGYSTITNNNEEFYGDILIGFCSMLILLDSGFGTEVICGEFYAIGSGYQYALGALEALSKFKQIPPRHRIRTALKATERRDAHVRPPFRILSVGPV